MKYLMLLNNKYDNYFHLNLRILDKEDSISSLVLNYNPELNKPYWILNNKHCFIIFESLDFETVIAALNKLKTFFIENTSKKFIDQSKEKTVNKLSIRDVMLWDDIKILNPDDRTYYLVQGSELKLVFTKTINNDFSTWLNDILNVYKFDLDTSSIMYYSSDNPEEQTDVYENTLDFFRSKVKIYSEDKKFSELVDQAESTICIHDKDPFDGYVYSVEGDLIKVSGFTCTKCKYQNIKIA